MCILCDLVFDRHRHGKKYSDEEHYFENAVRIADSDCSVMYGCKGVNGNIFLAAEGDDASFYYPKYCPECGRRLYENDEIREEIAKAEV